ncbi:MAG: Ig-like domain-containing protein [Halioglobus sp.]
MGDLIILQDGVNGYSGTTDTYLDGYATTYPRGGEDILNSVRNLFNPLVRFAIFSNEGGPVPEGATITYAALAMYKFSYYDYTYSAHPLKVNWVESQATWIEASAGIPWHKPGAAGNGSDYAAKGSQAYTGWDPGWVVFDVTDSVQSMSLKELSNYGWELIAGTGNENQKSFRASEYSADPTLRPKLILQVDENANRRPTVALTAPKNRTLYNNGDTITLSADANDPDGSITQVEFFSNGVSLGVDTAAPYTLDWSDAPAGNSRLTAVATDDAGASATSGVVIIHYLPPGC